MKKIEQGFIIQKVPFSETSIVVKIFTKTQGLKSFLVKGANKKYQSVFQPLSLIEFNYHHKNDEQLSILYNANLISNFQEIYFDHFKQSLIFFKIEFLRQCLHEGQNDEVLFNFILEEINYLNRTKFNPNYLIYWILTLSDILGIKPQLSNNKPTNFDLQNGEFSFSNSLSQKTIHNEILEKFALFFLYPKEEQLNIKLLKEERKKILEILIKYFSLHIETFRKINSLNVYQILWYD